MVIDIRTLAIVLCLGMVLQAVSLYIQYRMNDSKSGIDYWVAGSIFVAVGFILTLLRDIKQTMMISVIGSNTFLLTGQVCLLVGVERFLERKEESDWRIFPVVFSLVFIFSFFLYLIDSISVRIVVLSSVMSFIAFRTAYRLYFDKDIRIRQSVKFTMTAFLIVGVFLLLRVILTLAEPPMKDFFVPVSIQITSFLVPIVASMIWTFGFILMINQRLNAEIHEDRKNLEQIFNTSPDSVLITRFDDEKIVKTNEGFYSMSGFSADEALGRTLTEMGVWSSHDERNILIEELIIDEMCSSKEFVFHRKDGSEFNGSVSAKIITFLGEKHIISVTRDISEKKRMEKALLESEEKYRLLVENSHDIIYTLTADGFFTYVSPSWSELLGHRQEDVTGKSFQQFVHSDDITACLVWLRKVIESGERQKGIEYRVRHADGSWVWHTSSAVPFKDEKGTTIGYEGVAHDITERRMNENRIKSLLAEKELILKEVHHRIKNNMNTVYNILMLHAMSLKGTSAEKALKDAGDRVQNMMILYSKLYEKMGISEISVPMYISSLAKRAVESFPESSRITLEHEIEDFSMSANKLQPVGIILNELLTNIMKYAFSGRDEGLIKISVIRKLSLVKLTVEDNGIGMPDSVDFEKSTGFGLMLVGMMTKQLDASIAIKRGTGTSIVLEFEA